MSRRLALVWAPLLLSLAGPLVQAQQPLPHDIIPKRTSLARLGLERQWMTVVPLAGTEQVMRISRSQDLFFVQTDQAILHVYDAQTGQHRWSAKIGEQAPSARPVSANSFAVFATCANIMSALDRNTGRVIWQANMGSIPSSGTVCDEELVLVGMKTGMINCYDLKERQDKVPDKIRDKPELAWNLQTNGPVMTRPLLADRIVCMGSSDGRVYVNMAHEPTPLYRVPTGGAIGDELGYHGTRTLLIPSADRNLYAVDVLTSKTLWVFPSGDPIDQAPVIAGDDVFVINQAGNLSVLEPSTGSPRWTTATNSGRFLGVSPTKVYLRSGEKDLMTVDRVSGKVLADPAATFQRAGLNLREYDLSFSDRFDDRLYLGTVSGVVICLRENGLTTPQPLRDPKALPFGHVPPEGIKETPQAPPAVDADSSEPSEDVEKHEAEPEADPQF